MKITLLDLTSGRIVSIRPDNHVSCTDVRTRLPKRSLVIQLRCRTEVIGAGDTSFLHTPDEDLRKIGPTSLVVYTTGDGDQPKREDLRVQSAWQSLPDNTLVLVVLLQGTGVTSELVDCTVNGLDDVLAAHVRRVLTPHLTVEDIDGLTKATKGNKQRS